LRYFVESFLIAISLRLISQVNVIPLKPTIMTMSFYYSFVKVTIIILTQAL